MKKKIECSKLSKLIAQFKSIGLTKPKTNSY